ncbi:LapA family protein [Oceanispirochaeta sp.]|jgi:uncharacterized integral membrane protein|uniref:LapA family protein n=1 Tax=Oceanispirochaeta sp. TaxID=2035350 RepID=UPI002606A81B|nr:LapA family protein [Oceanispirochaeta sp.]MDA3957939.1 LapA family protein [Oceanispirochaeta sp.]
MFRFIFGILIGIVCLILFIQNSVPVQVNFLMWSLTMPRFILLLSMLFAGILFGWIGSSLGQLKRNKKK